VTRQSVSSSASRVLSQRTRSASTVAAWIQSSHFAKFRFFQLVIDHFEGHQLKKLTCRRKTISFSFAIRLATQYRMSQHNLEIGLESLKLACGRATLQEIGDTELGNVRPAEEFIQQHQTK
jgi:hypothetical protein